MNCIEEHQESLKLITNAWNKQQIKIKALELIDNKAKEDYMNLYVLKSDRHQLASMKVELEWKIKWMLTAREPGSRNGIDNHKAVKSYW